jgi:hypothetical protein
MCRRPLPPDPQLRLQRPLPLLERANRALGRLDRQAALVHVGFVHSQECGAEMNLLRSELGHRVYATHFILNFLRFLAQSTR